MPYIWLIHMENSLSVKEKTLLISVIGKSFVKCFLDIEGVAFEQGINAFNILRFDPAVALLKKIPEYGRKNIPARFYRLQ